VSLVLINEYRLRANFRGVALDFRYCGSSFVVRVTADDLWYYTRCTGSGVAFQFGGPILVFGARRLDIDAQSFTVRWL
jgi:hypothetical protein